MTKKFKEKQSDEKFKIICVFKIQFLIKKQNPKL